MSGFFSKSVRELGSRLFTCLPPIPLVCVGAYLDHSLVSLKPFIKSTEKAVIVSV